MQEVLKDFEHDWESHLLLREADAKGAAAVPVAAPADCLDAVPDAPTVREEDEQLLLPGTTWPFAGPRGSVLAHDVQRLARELAMDFYGRRFQPHCSDAMEYNPQWNHGIQDGSHLHLAPLQRLFLGGRAIYNTEPTPFDDEWVDPSSLRSSLAARCRALGRFTPATAGYRRQVQLICRLRWPVRRELTTCAFHVAPRLQASLPLLHRGPSLSPTVFYRPATPRRRPPKLGIRARRALLERPAAGPGHWLGEEVGVEGVPPVPLPGASAGPSSDASGSYSREGSECDDWCHDPGLRGFSASEDGSECDGWRCELGADEVCENYMDAKFGGEGADMAESQRS